MDGLGFICSFLSVICLVTGSVWGVLLLVDLIKRSKLPRLAHAMAVLSLFAAVPVGFGVDLLLDTKRAGLSGQHVRPDGNMLVYIFAAVGAATIFICAGIWVASRLHKSSRS